MSRNAADPLIFQDGAGTGKRLADLRGSIVILNFWATWCVPCREEMPLLVKIQREFTNRGVVVVGASADDDTTRAQVDPFVKKLGITFPIWTGATTDHMQRLGMGTGLPVTAIFDRNGDLGFRLLGVLKRKEVVERLEYLLGDRTGASPGSLVDHITAETAALAAKSKDKHEDEENHHHGGVSMEGASTVPS